MSGVRSIVYRRCTPLRGAGLVQSDDSPPIFSKPAPRPGEWSRQQKRAYHRISSILTYWQAHGYQVRWITLTSSATSHSPSLAYHHQILRQRVERKLHYPRIEHFSLRTTEGNGVLHIFWAWKPTHQAPRRLFFVPQNWLSDQWSAIHGAPIVWIAKVYFGKTGVRRLSSYCVKHYLAGHSDFRASWSYRRTYGFPLVKFWMLFKRSILDHQCRATKGQLILSWQHFLSGLLLPTVHGYLMSLFKVRAAYRKYGIAAFVPFSPWFSLYDHEYL